MSWKDQAKGIASFVTGNNLFPIVLIVVGFFVYQKCARHPETGPPPGSKPGPVTEAEEPKYVQEIRRLAIAMGKPQIIIIPGSGQAVATLPKEELEKKRPGSVAPEVLADNNAQITARTEIPPSRGKTQVDAIGRIGQDNVYRIHFDSQQLPSPWFDLKKEWHFGVGYGLAGPNVAEAWVKAQPLRLWEVETYAEGRIGMERDGGRFNGQITVGVQY